MVIEKVVKALAATCLLVLLAPSLLHAELTRDDKRAIKQALKGETFYLRTDAPAKVGFTGFGLSFDPLVEVSPRGVTTDYDRFSFFGDGISDGGLQGALESIAMPYTGSGVLGSALAMDKYRTKLVWRALGIPTPESYVVRDETALEEAAARVGFPAFVKPVHEGSSIGTAPVGDGEDLHRAWHGAAQFDGDVLVERLIDGPEYTASILDDEVLPLIRLQSARTFYDYEAKYADGAGTQYHCPCGLDRDHEDRLRALSLEAFRAVGARGWGRVDLLCDGDGNPWFIDVNTAPGMTSHSLVPMAAAAAGMSMEDLVVRILESAT